MSQVKITLSGLSGLGVVLLGLALATKQFGDTYLYYFCAGAGVFCVVAVITTRLFEYVKDRTQ